MGHSVLLETRLQHFQAYYLQPPSDVITAFFKNLFRSQLSTSSAFFFHDYSLSLYFSRLVSPSVPFSLPPSLSPSFPPSLLPSLPHSLAPSISLPPYLPSLPPSIPPSLPPSPPSLPSLPPSLPPSLLPNAISPSPPPLTLLLHLGHRPVA